MRNLITLEWTRLCSFEIWSLTVCTLNSEQGLNSNFFLLFNFLFLLFCQLAGRLRSLGSAMFSWHSHTKESSSMDYCQWIMAMAKAGKYQRLIFYFTRTDIFSRALVFITVLRMGKWVNGKFGECFGLLNTYPPGQHADYSSTGSV